MSIIGQTAFQGYQKRSREPNGNRTWENRLMREWKIRRTTEMREGKFRIYIMRSKNIFENRNKMKENFEKYN